MPITIFPVLPPLSKISHFILSLFLFSHSASNWSWGFFLIFCHFFHPQRLIKVGDNLISEIYFGGNIFFSSPFLSQLVFRPLGPILQKAFSIAQIYPAAVSQVLLEVQSQSQRKFKKKKKKKDCPFLTSIFFLQPSGWSGCA